MRARIPGAILPHLRAVAAFSVSSEIGTACGRPPHPARPSEENLATSPGPLKAIYGVYCIEHNGELWHGSQTVATSPFHERINLLCSQAVSVDDPEEFNRVFVELRNALRGQLDHLKDMVDEAKQTIAQLPGKARAERRGMERRKAERRKVLRGGSN
jgi:hypothetical protein